jgi:DNA-binding HxlR family transcriptional regulator
MLKPTSQRRIPQNGLALLGDYWILRIIEALEDGERRFCEVQRACGGVNPATLTKKLAALTEAGLVALRRDEAASYYRLTRRGARALPVLAAMRTFADTLRRPD